MQLQRKTNETMSGIFLKYDRRYLNTAFAQLISKLDTKKFKKHNYLIFVAPSSILKVLKMSLYNRCGKEQSCRAS